MKTEKQACSIENFTFDWSDFYTEMGLDPIVSPITSSVWTVEGGTVVLGSNTITSPLTTTKISAGAEGELAVVENTIEIQDGAFKDCRKLFITVK